MNKCFLFFLLATIAINTKIYSQEFGGNPSSIKWNQINTDTVRVIFPEELAGAGRKVSTIVHDLQKNHATLGGKVQKINIVLQNQTTVSNAYVGLGPYRSEFYLFAPQNSFRLGALPWVETLSLHEYRHVQQYNNFNVGLAKVAGVLFGQQGRAFANAAAVPDWFFEGDAVFNETSLSKQGRGRIPNFFNGYQALSLQRKNYSYMKLRNGSLKDYVPNHYELGYLLVGYGREKYGPDFWKKVSQDAARFKGLIYPWQTAVTKYSGVSYKKFLADAVTFYQSKWSDRKTVTVQYITPKKKNNVTNYSYPYLESSGQLIVLKNSYRQIPAFYRVDYAGKETKIAVRDIANDDYFSYNNGKIVYSSYKADKRWGYREYSDIKILEVASGKTTKLTTKQRLFSPDISHDTVKVIAVEMKTNQESNLVSMNLHGDIIFRSKATRGIVYTYPKFSKDDLHIYSAVRNEDGNMALLKLELATGRETWVLPFANRVLGFPVVQGDTVFFTSSYKGNDEIWAYDDINKKVFRVAVAQTGLYQGAYDTKNQTLVASNFTADGYRLAAMSEKLLWQPVNEKENALPDLYVPEALSKEDKTTLENIETRQFPISKYKKSYNLLNFHSWKPYYDESEISFTFLGENVLNTLQSELSYTYNRNESSHRAGFNAIYGGWFLQPLAGISNTWDRNVSYNADTTFKYDEFNANAGLRLPLNFSKGKTYRYLTLTGTINNQQVKLKGLGKNFFQNQDFFYWQGRLQYSSQIQQAVQQIYPRWAQTLLLQYRSIINNYTANQFLASGYFYLPGLHSTHNIVLSAAYQGRDTMSQYSFANNFPFSRGYNGLNFPRMFRIGTNYHLPLIYPDWGFGNIVYFKRIRGNGFYDYSRIKSLRTGNTFNFRTTGAELFFDTKWWNQQDVTFGIRYSHLLDANLVGRNPNQWEIILPIGLY